MKNTVSLSPISALHEDLLWNIFSTNADLDSAIGYPRRDIKSNPLLTTIYSSQVSRSWREILLRSSSLWGNVIDINEMGYFSDVGRGEILRRTGDALLCVKGFPNVRVEGSQQDLIVHILTECWTRVRKLDLLCYLVPGTTDEKTWRLLEQPAHHLEVFHLGFLFDHPQVMDTDPYLLFQNMAPRLTHFSAQPFKFNIHAPWISNLRELSINRKVISYPIFVQEVLQILQKTTFLEYLSFSSQYVGHRNHTSEEIPNDRSLSLSMPAPQSISLPYLRSITLFNPLAPSMAILDKINPPPGCGFSLGTYDGNSSQAISKDEIAGAHAASYCAAHGPMNAVTIEVTNTRLVLRLHPAAKLPEWKADDQRFYLEFCRNDLSDIWTHILPLVNNHTYSSVTALHLWFEWMPSKDLLTILERDLASFFAAFPNVELLELSPATLALVSGRLEEYKLAHLHGFDFSPGTSPIPVPNTNSGEKSPAPSCFPNLRTLKFAPHFYLGPDWTTIADFLELRRLANKSISTVDLPMDLQHFPKLIEMFKQHFDRFEGLKVRFLVKDFSREYVCGSGVSTEDVISGAPLVSDEF